MKNKILLALLFLSLAIPALMWKNSLSASMPGAKEIVQKAVQNMSGANSLQAEISMKVYVNNGEQTETMIKIWQKTSENILVLVNAPARDKGTTFLRKGKEVWKWQPALEKLSKLSTPETEEKWMNTHLTVADVLNCNSLTDDFFASFKNLTKFNGNECYIIELVPNSEASQAWFRILIWVNSKNYVIQKAEYYDEDDYLINTATTLQTQQIGNKTIPQTIAWKPAAESGEQTLVEYKLLNYDPVPDSVFTLENMKEVR